MRVFHSTTPTASAPPLATTMPPSLVKSISKDKLWNEEDASMHSDACSTASTDLCGDDHLVDRPSNEKPARIFHSAKMWLMGATEEHRTRLSDQVKKNWIRLVLSVAVVVIQYVWFASYYIGLNGTTDEANYSRLQLASQQNVATKDDRPSSLIYSLPAYPLVDAAVIVNNSRDTGGIQNELGQYNSKKQSDMPQPQAMPKNHQYQHCIFENVGNKPQLLDRSPPPEPWPSLLWRLLSGLKLALILIGFELIRLFDTILVIFQRTRHQDDRNRKSFIDLSYIERNRGYK